MKGVSLNIKIKCLRESFTDQNHSQFKRFTEKSLKITKKFASSIVLQGICFFYVI